MENMKKVFEEINLNLERFSKEFPKEMEAFGREIRLSFVWSSC